MRKYVIAILVLLVPTFLVSCGGAKPIAEQGDTVRVDYVGTLDDGEEFDSSKGEGREPLEFVIGDGSMIPGFDAGVRGLSVGQTKTIRIDPKDAYGDKIMQQTLPLNVIQDIVGADVTLTAGESYEPANNPPFKVIEVGEDDILIEFENNHPLAGQSLNFEIEMVDITKGEASQAAPVEENQAEATN